MKTMMWLSLGAVSIAAVTFSALAGASGSKTYRTITYFTGVAQRPDTQTPTTDFVPLSGRNLVNLAMGRDVGATNVPSQVLALTFPCDLIGSNIAVSLVVYDTNTTSLVGTIADSARVDFVNNITTNRVPTILGKTNEVARFVALLQILPTGNATNALLGGYLTVAGRVHIDPATGCLLTVPVALDKDKSDRTYADKEVPNNRDPDKVKLRTRTGLATLMGAVDVLANGATNTVLVPLGNLSIRYDLPVTSTP